MKNKRRYPNKNKKCLNCNREFLIKNSKYNQKFCSFGCYIKFPKSIETKQKISFYIQRNPIKNRPKGKNVYNYNKQEKECKFCHKRFLVSPAFKDKAKFCSQKCNHEVQKVIMSGDKSPNWRGGFYKYSGSGWIKLREKVYKRDGYCCRICGKGRKHGRRIAAHHLIPDRFSSKFKEIGAQLNHLKNLITLCSSCHAKLEHTFYDETIRKGMIPFFLIAEDVQDDKYGGRGTITRII